MNMSNLRKVLTENGFPRLVAALMYAPLVLVILALNAVRAEILALVSLFILAVVAFMLLGAIFSLLFVCIKGG